MSTKKYPKLSSLHHSDEENWARKLAVARSMRKLVFKENISMRCTSTNATFLIFYVLNIIFIFVKWHTTVDADEKINMIWYHCRNAQKV